MSGFIIEPTSGQEQVPGSFQSYVRVVATPQDPTSITTFETAPGEPLGAVPDFGFVSWRYVTGGVRRYGGKVFIGLRLQVLVSDQPQFPFDRLLVVPRPGVSINASLRRVAI